MLKLVNMTVGRLTDSISPRWTEKNVRKIGYYIHAGFIFSNKYSATAHICDKNLGWSASKITIVFCLGAQTKLLFTGSLGVSPIKMCLEFHKDGSMGESTIGYSFYVK